VEPVRRTVAWGGEIGNTGGVAQTETTHSYSL